MCEYSDWLKLWKSFTMKPDQTSLFRAFSLQIVRPPQSTVRSQEQATPNLTALSWYKMIWWGIKAEAVCKQIITLNFTVPVHH